MAGYVFSSGCVSMCYQYNFFCKQDVSKTDLRIFGKLIADIHYLLPRKWLTFGADHFQDGCE